MVLNRGDLVRVLGKTVTLDGITYMDPLGILLDRWDERLWNILIFNSIATVHEVRIQIITT